MTCQEVREQLSAYLDEELEPAGRAEVRRHVEGCPACRAELESLKRTIQVVGSLPRVAAPESIFEELKDQLARETLLAPVEMPPRTGRRRRVAALSGIMAAAAALLVAFIIFMQTPPPARDTAPMPPDVAALDKNGDGLLKSGSANEATETGALGGTSGSEAFAFKAGAPSADEGYANLVGRRVRTYNDIVPQGSYLASPRQVSLVVNGIDAAEVRTVMNGAVNRLRSNQQALPYNDERARWASTVKPEDSAKTDDVAMKARTSDLDKEQEVLPKDQSSVPAKRLDTGGAAGTQVTGQVAGQRGQAAPEPGFEGRARTATDTKLTEESGLVMEIELTPDEFAELMIELGRNSEVQVSQLNLDFGPPNVPAQANTRQTEQPPILDQNRAIPIDQLATREMPAPSRMAPGQPAAPATPAAEPERMAREEARRAVTVGKAAGPALGDSGSKKQEDGRKEAQGELKNGTVPEAGAAYREKSELERRSEVQQETTARPVAPAATTQQTTAPETQQSASEVRDSGTPPTGAPPGPVTQEGEQQQQQRFQAQQNQNLPMPRQAWANGQAQNAQGQRLIRLRVYLFAATANSAQTAPVTAPQQQAPAAEQTQTQPTGR